MKIDESTPNNTNFKGSYSQSKCIKLPGFSDPGL